ncbi:hypothetical protein QJS66_20480 [Kocuria rhizophila]|nr:hypothetical protein QJS66_20480 [Kocuria rhizophila]
MLSRRRSPRRSCANKLLFTLAIIVIYRLGPHPPPGMDYGDVSSSVSPWETPPGRA